MLDGFAVVEDAGIVPESVVEKRKNVSHQQRDILE
jgi:hypothetical protein